MIFNDNEDTGTRLTSLQDLTPPLNYTLPLAMRGAWNDNVASMAYDKYQEYQANQSGKKLDANELDTMVKQAGVTGFGLPEGQYTKQAAALLIERRRQKQMEDDVFSNIGMSWGETPIRAAGRIAATLADPFNVAAMFFPPAGALGFAEKLAAATTAGARFGIRAAEGAATGGMGMGLLELANYPLHNALRDDYTSTDSLVSILSGAGLGGALHAAGGALLDRLAPGNWKLENGLEDKLKDFPELLVRRTERGGPAGGDAYRVVANPDRGEVTTAYRMMAAEMAGRSSPDERQAMAHVAAAQFLEGKPVNVDPLADAVSGIRRTAGEARAEALGNLREELRAELLPQVGAEHDSATIRALTTEKEQLQAKLQTVDVNAQVAALREKGMSLSDAVDAAARRTASDRELRADLGAQLAHVNTQLDISAKSEQATKALDLLDKGIVPSRFAARVQAEADRISSIGQMRPAMRGIQAALHPAPVTPQVFDRTVQDLRAGLQRPVESVTEAHEPIPAEKPPTSPALEQATAEVTTAMQRLTGAVDALKAAGVDKDFTKALEPFDKAISESAIIARAVKVAANCGVST